MNSKEKGEDRLSSLPDPILIHILSFLPTLEAIRTMQIKRFGTLWTSLPSLDLDHSSFDIWHGDDDEGLSTLNLAFFVYVHNVLMRHRWPKLENFRVNINEMSYYDIEEKNHSHELEACINFALRKQVKVLEFFVGMVEPDEVLYKWPHSDLVSHSLVELTLEWLELKLMGRVQMGSLRVLRLKRVTLSDTVFREIIRGCPLLKELEIYNCWDLLEVIFNAANIEKLKFDATEFGTYSDKIMINCPMLRSLECGGCVEVLEVIDLSSLVDVALSDGCRSEFNALPQFKSVLSKILHAKSVTLSCEFVTVLFYLMQKDLENLSNNWKHVELNIWLTDRHIPSICFLLRNSPDIEELVLNVRTLHSDWLELIEAELTNLMSEEPECWSNVKRIVIRSNSRNAHGALVKLVEILLKNASFLDELVIDSNWKLDSSIDCELTTQQWMDFTDKLMRFSKASKHCIVMLC